MDGVLFCNEADYPYQLEVGPEIAAAMAAVIGRLRARRSRVPFGVNLLWDPMASLAVARATGAAFIREVLTGVYESDLGIMRPDIGEIAAYRTTIGARRRRPVRQHHAGVRQRARQRGRSPTGPAGAAFLGMDAILISGRAAGSPMAMGDLLAAKDGGARHAGHRQHRRSGRSGRPRS